MSLIAWTLIVEGGKDENAVPLEKALKSIHEYMDGIFIQLNARKGVKISPKVRAVAEKYTTPDKIFTFEWKDNFAKARNDLMEKIPKKFEWIGWMDIDDTIDKPEAIHPVCDVMPKSVDGIHILYDYQKDDFGNVVVSHWSCRVVRNNGSYHWKSSFDDDEAAVHETLVPKRNGQAVSNNEFKVIHDAEPGHFRQSLLRNIDLLEKMLARHQTRPEGPDPRILFYLGTHYHEAFRFTEAKDAFIAYLKLSGWPEEISEAHVHLGQIIRDVDRKPALARNAFLQALGAYPKNPNALLELARLEAREQLWDKAIVWFKQAVENDSPVTGMVRFNNDWELYTEYAQALSNVGGKSLSEALRMAQKAYKLRPLDPVSEINRDSLENLINLRDNTKALTRMVRELRTDKQEDKILPLVSNLPNSMSDSPVVQQIIQDYTPAKKWPKKSIAIYCGQSTLGTWGPSSLNGQGIGGSEEAIIRLSRELTKLGWKITVYASPGKDMGDNDGVTWLPYWYINQKDEFDVLISWRGPEFFDFKWNARKKYLWLHDVMPKEEFSKERLKNLDKIIYVSKYHAERPESLHIPDGKKFVSGNGITPEDFEKLDGKFERDPHRCIYMSANERGLRVLLDIWPDVKKAVPDATLDTYYGWDSFDAVNRDNPERMAWKALMIARMRELDGVTERGRIGQDKLNEETFKSGIFAYPCIFPEVSCITCLKAQSGGAWPVTSTFAALKDNVLVGDKVDMGKFTTNNIEKYKQTLIERLKNPPSSKERQHMMTWARSKFAWENTAEGWNDEFQTK